MEKSKEPMIGSEARPTAIDFDAPIADFKMRDLVSVVQSQIHVTEKEWAKSEKELHKPEKELLKPEKERFKPEKEFHKPEKELLKPEKEALKPEGFKPEASKPVDFTDEFMDKLAVRLADVLAQRGLLKK